ncbi:MAG: chorismate mutase [Bacteroidota bacterium]
MTGIANIEDWALGYTKPFLIAGPCSAENERQILETAEALAKDGRVSLFRCGLWKPRTRPGNFEGVGKRGLLWLKHVHSETGLNTCVEVATKEHVKLCLDAGIHAVWIGARTTVNPFSIQELTESLVGSDIPVFVKNPVHPDIELWIGVIERLLKEGINKVVAIHRGFHVMNRAPFRNAPLWEIPIELKRRYPDLPVICDPSHISGKKSLISQVCQQALDLDMNGLMIETHIHPEKALTDKRQQISPDELSSLLDSLVFKSAHCNSQSQDVLARLRSEIDVLDATMLETLARRMEVVREIGEYKAGHNITILQIRRWIEIITDRIASGEQSGLDREFIHNLLQLVHKESIRVQSEILQNKSRKIE